MGHGAPFTVNVNWGVDDSWHNADDNLKATTGIASYIVGHSSSPIYDYYIQITTSQDYDYKFTDASPDNYDLNVVNTSDEHIVRYNSGSPTVKFVSGS